MYICRISHASNLLPHPGRLRARRKPPQALLLWLVVLWLFTISSSSSSIVIISISIIIMITIIIVYYISSSSSSSSSSRIITITITITKCHDEHYITTTRIIITITIVRNRVAAARVRRVGGEGAYYTRSPLQDSRLFRPRPWKISATTYEKKDSWATQTLAKIL